LRLCDTRRTLLLAIAAVAAVAHERARDAHHADCRASGDFLCGA
jgi:hypothetical protein